MTTAIKPRNTIAIMNTKGGVGKSTLTLALAETLSSEHGLNVLVIDADAQASVSAMLMAPENLHRVQVGQHSLVDMLVATVLHETNVDWSQFVVGGVSDNEDARTIYLIPSDMQLTLFEREVSKENLHGRLRQAIGGLLGEVRRVFDLVLIDCPPGLSVLTESWLREADFHITPTKPDYVSVCGLEVFRRFRNFNPEMGFAENLGVVVTMKEAGAEIDEHYHRWLAGNAENRLFPVAVPRSVAMQRATQFGAAPRSHGVKYPGDSGAALRVLATEVRARVGGPAASRPAAVAPPRLKAAE